MRTLYVLRHAKSSWDDPALPDHERPLAARGRRAARALRQHCAAAGIEPDLVLCSTARRARETLDLVAPALGTPTLLVEDELYGASAAELLERLRRPSEATVLVVGHDPGLRDLVLLLARPGPLRDRVAVKLATGSLATLEVDALEPGGATLVDLVTPRELEPS